MPARSGKSHFYLWYLQRNVANRWRQQQEFTQMGHQELG